MSNLIRHPISLPNTRPPSPSAMSTSSDRMTPEPHSRPWLSTSVSDFALPSSSSSSSSSGSSHLASTSQTISQTKDDSSPLIHRLRRPTYVGLKSALLADARVHSPLASSFTLPPPKTLKDTGTGTIQEAFQDRDRMMTDGSPSSGSDVPTPPSVGSFFMEDSIDKPTYSTLRPSSPSTPPRVMSAPAEARDPVQRFQGRRLSYPPKPPRLLTLATESRPEEIEVKSEAQFQRLLASYSGLPSGLGQNKTSRAMSDKGRYPEEAGVEDEIQREDTPSDDEVDDDGAGSSGYKAQTGASEPINFTRPTTPAHSIGGTLDDGTMWVSESPGAHGLMDIDMVPMSISGSPSLSTGPPPNQWRQTPPPAASAVRTSKRKYEERFEPYAPSAKRRAVSPSLSTLRDSRGLVTPIAIPRSPVLRSRGSFSQSQSNSATSSPTISQSSSQHNLNGYLLSSSQSNSLVQNGASNGFTHHRTGSASSPSMTSSPTVRASLTLASPVIRPVPRLAVGVKRGTSFAEVEGEREVEGAQEGVGCLNIG